MIPIFVNAGGRVIAPDFFGFGRSDKPINDSDITFSFHRNSLLRLIEQLNLQNITLVCQDWGGILGLTLPGNMANRFKRLIVMNTALPVGESLGEGFEMWKSYAAQFNDVSVSGLLAANCPGVLDLMDIAAYAAPFPDATYKAGVRRFPELVAVNPGMEGVKYAEDAKRFLSTEWNGQSFMAVGSLDPFFGQSIMDNLRSTIKNCPDPVVYSDVGHFVQEWGEDVAKKALKHFDTA
jgi:pimeloyl-ACP methyl ester carboxylesterase